MENKEQIRLTTPASFTYALSMSGEGASENLVSSHSTARKGGGTTAAKYESGIVSEVNGDVHVNLTKIEAVKQAKLKEKIKKHLEKIFGKDRKDIPDDPKEKEKFLAAKMDEWSLKALKEAVEGADVSRDVDKIQSDMVRLVYDIAEREGFKNIEDQVNDDGIKQLIRRFRHDDQIAEAVTEAHVEPTAVAANGKATLHQTQINAETQLHQRAIPEAIDEKLQMYRDVFPNQFHDENLENIRQNFLELVERENPDNHLYDEALPGQPPNPEKAQPVKSEDFNNAIKLLENRLNQHPSIQHVVNALVPGAGQAEASAVIQAIANLRSIATTLEGQEGKEIGENRTKQRWQEQVIEGVVDDETGREMNISKIIWHRRSRDKIFNDLYKGVDSKPHEFWDRAFNPLIEGQREHYFMSYVQNIYQGTRQKLEQDHGTEVLQEYYALRQGDFAQMPEMGIPPGGAPPAPNALTPQQREHIFAVLQTELRNDHETYSKERQARETLHNANAILHRTDIQPEQLFGFIKQFGGDLGDRAHRFIGVRQMMDIYEEQLRLAMAEKNGYLSAEDVLGKTSSSSRIERGNKVTIHTRQDKSVVEERAKRIFNDRYNRGLIYQQLDNGEVVNMRSTLNGAQLQEWELGRIMTISRGMMIASERLISLAAESRLTKASQINQYFLQDILYAYSPRTHLEAKYFVPGPKPTAALIFEEGEGHWGPGDLWIKPHHVKSMKQRHHEYKHGAVDFLENHEITQMNKQNPNRCGDLYTWLSWRMETGLHNNESISRDFMRQGWDFMLDTYRTQNAESQAFQQLRAANNIGAAGPTTREEFFHRFATGVDYITLDPESHAPPNIEEIAAMNMYIYINGTPGNREQIQEMRDNLNEYSKWLGTGLRFEKMRSTLDYLGSRDAEKNQNARDSVVPAMALLEKIIEYQPDKIFLKSHKIQGRVMQSLRDEWAAPNWLQQNGQMGPLQYVPMSGGAPIEIAPNGVFNEANFQDILRRTTEDLGYMRDAVTENRDTLLRQGVRFDDLRFIDQQGNVDYNLDIVLDRTQPNNDRIPDPRSQTGFVEPPNPADQYYTGPGGPQRLANDQASYQALLLERQTVRNHLDNQLQNGTVRTFVELMREDWDQHHGGLDEEGGAIRGEPTYFEEFIKYRENYHGFVLWSGDAPVDLLKMTAIGQTGAFTMRAGNNMDNAKASIAENELLGHLKDLRKPEDVVGALTAIYKPVQNYDLDLAQELMGEWTDAMLKVYGSDFMSVLPIIGGIKKYAGLASFIQSWYGKRMPVWQAAEKRLFVDLMKERGLITPAKYKELLPVARARNWLEVPVDKLNFPLQLIALATLLYIAKETFDDD